MSDDMPYDRIRERILSDAAAPPEPMTPQPPAPPSTGPRELTDAERREAADWVAFVKASRERCDAGDCKNHDCDLGRKCPFKRFKRGAPR